MELELDCIGIVLSFLDVVPSVIYAQRVSKLWCAAVRRQPEVTHATFQGPFTMITPPELIRLLRNFPTLEYLDLSESEFASGGRHLVEIPALLPRLKSLKLHNALPSAVMRAIVGAPLLEELSINNGTSLQLPSGGNAASAVRCSKLESLTLMAAPHLTPTQLSALLRCCAPHALRHLTLHGTPQIGPRICSLLQQIFGGVGEGGVVENPPKKRRLQSNGPSAAAAAAAAVSDAPPPPPLGLRTLTLSQCGSFPSGPGGLPRTLLDVGATRCLRWLDLSHCTGQIQLTMPGGGGGGGGGGAGAGGVDGGDGVGGGAGFPHLRVLLLERTQITGRDVINLANQTPRLRVLSLARCARMGDEGLVEWVSTCSRLKRVDLSGSRVTEATVAALRTCCPRLQSIKLESCRSVSREVRQRESKLQNTPTPGGGSTSSSIGSSSTMNSSSSPSKNLGVYPDNDTSSGGEEDEDYVRVRLWDRHGAVAEQEAFLGARERAIDSAMEAEERRAVQRRRLQRKGLYY